MWIQVFPPVPGPLDVVPLDDFVLGVEDIGHDNEITPIHYLSTLILLDQLVQAKELCDHGLRVLLQVVVVVFQNGPEELVLPILNGFEHVLAISCVVEERATFALTREGSHGVDLAHHEGCHQLIGPYTLNVFLIVDVEDLSDVVEGLWGIVSEATNLRDIFFITESPGHQFEVVFEVEVFGFFVDHFLVASDTSHCHLDAYHHVED